MPRSRVQLLDSANAMYEAGDITRAQWLALVEEAYAPALDLGASDGDVGGPAPELPTSTTRNSSALGESTREGADVLATPPLPRRSLLYAVETPDGPATVEAGAPSLAAGVKVYDTGGGDDEGIVNKPTWASPATNKLIDSAIDFNPDVAHAKWMAARLGLHDWTLKAYVLDANGETDEPDEDAKGEAIRFAKRAFGAYGGGVDAMLEVALDSVLRRGAAAPELDVADSRDDVLDVDFIDPTHVNFRVIKDGKHRRVIRVYQPTSGGEAVPFSPVTSAYFGINKSFGKPHGSTPYLSVIETVPRQKQYRDQVGRVLANSAFARTLLKLNYDRVAKTAGPDVVQVANDGAYRVLDYGKFVAFMNARRADVVAQTEDMYGDDVWVIYDQVEAETIGADHAKGTLDPTKMAELTDTDVIAGIHSQPAMHGRSYGHDLSSTGQVQWVVTALSIEAMAGYALRSVEWILTTYLRIRGISAYVVLDVPAIRKEDRKADAEAAKIEAETQALLVDRGWITDDEAATKIAGHDAAGAAAPKAEPKPAASTQGAPSTSVTELDGRVPNYPTTPANVDSDRSVTDVDGAHSETCGCPTCTPRADLAPPFVPDDPRAAALPEIVAGYRIDSEAADEAARSGRAEVAKFLPAWAGIYFAVEVGEPADTGLSRLAAPVKEWKSDRWQWDPSISRYRYPPGKGREGTLGRIVPPDRVRRLLDRQVSREASALRSLARSLADGRIGITDLQREMAKRLGRRHLQAHMLAAGGRDQMGSAQLLDVSARWEKDARFLAEFGQRIARGELSEAQIVHNAEQYASANLRAEYEETRSADARRAGFAEELWYLNPADHCAGCEAQAMRGWVAIGELPEIGSQECRMGCHCGKRQRYSADSELPPRSGAKGGGDGEFVVVWPLPAVPSARSAAANGVHA